MFGFSGKDLFTFNPDLVTGDDDDADDVVIEREVDPEEVNQGLSWIGLSEWAGLNGADGGASYSETHHICTLLGTTADNPIKTSQLHLFTGSLWFAMVRYGSLWFAMVRYGSLWFAMVRYL